MPPALAAPKPRPEEWWFDAWEITSKVWPITQGSGVTVALIDSGVAAQLPDLKGVVLPGVGYDGASSEDGRVDDDDQKGGHGTSMAALIAAQGVGTGMLGIAPKSRILPISASANDYAKPIRFAVDHGAKVINMSEGVGMAYCPIDIQDAVTYAVEHDAVVIASAGNNASVDSATAPANCKGVVAVGAVDAHLNVWEMSSPGNNVMVAAPGVYVGSIGRAGTYMARLSGTSQAAALAAGVAALMRSRFPEMSAREVVQRLLATARDVGPKGWDKRTGYGAIIPYKALTAAVPKTAPNPVYDDLGSGVRGRSGQAVSEARRTGAASESRDSGLGGSGGLVIAAVVLVVGGLGAGGAVFARRRMIRKG
ncbi:S8 family serine peptidase [Actinomadura nitritigenes]|uniref:S8 family serine peptidase n=1 Tax=Actinomadura nitritigenes TaxID=134602 RepID=UPI003D9051B7